MSATTTTCSQSRGFNSIKQIVTLFGWLVNTSNSSDWIAPHRCLCKSLAVVSSIHRPQSFVITCWVATGKRRIMTFRNSSRLSMMTSNSHLNTQISLRWSSCCWSRSIWNTWMTHDRLTRSMFCAMSWRHFNIIRRVFTSCRATWCVQTVMSYMSAQLGKARTFDLVRGWWIAYNHFCQPALCYHHVVFIRCCVKP